MAYAGSIVNKIPDLNTRDLLLLGAPAARPLVHWAAVKIAAPVRPETVKLTVLVDKLNVRSGPNKDETYWHRLTRATCLQVLDSTKDRHWLMVCCVDGQPGYVFYSSEYVATTPEDGLERLL